MSKKKISYEYGVDLRTVQRYIKELNDFFEEHDKNNNEHIRRIEYNSKKSVYELVNRNSESSLSDGDILAICKIILESRAFSKSEMERIGQKKLLDKTYVANRIYDIINSDIISGSVVEIDE